VFVSGKPIQLSLLFVGEARILPESEAPERSFTWQGSGLTFKYYIRLERLAGDKHSSFLQKYVNYGCKKFIVHAPGQLVTNK
jgi:hypothetical protein